MEKYNYRANETADIVDYIKENGIEVTEENRQEISEKLNEELWDCDSITGNASGSYTYNSWEAEENICHNLDLLGEALEEFGCDNYGEYLGDAEKCDVAIRCYLLGECIDAALDSIIGNKF